LLVDECSLTSAGTGLFVGSGSALAHGGPASLLIAFGLIGIMLYCTVREVFDHPYTRPTDALDGIDMP
jgi:L-asparagine transporter-like permease